MRKLAQRHGDPYRCFGRHLSWGHQQWIGWIALLAYALILWIAYG